MAEDQSKDEEKSRWEGFLAWRGHNFEQLPAAGAEFAALWREARKDSNSALHQVFFGQPPGMGEPGTPLVPTQAQVTEALGNVHAYGALLEDAGVHGAAQQKQDKGIER